MRVELQPLKIVERGEGLLSMTLTNLSAKSIWVAINQDSPIVVRDADGFEYHPARFSISGVRIGELAKAYFGNADMSHTRFSGATEIQPHDSISAAMKFASDDRRPLQAGVCNLQMEILIGHGFDQNAVTIATKNLTTKIAAH